MHPSCLRRALGGVQARVFNMSRTTTRSRGKELSVEDDLGSLEKLLVAQTVYEFGREAWSTVAQLLTEHPSLDRPKGSFTARVRYLLFPATSRSYLAAPVMSSHSLSSLGGS